MAHPRGERRLAVDAVPPDRRSEPRSHSRRDSFGSSSLCRIHCFTALLLSLLTIPLPLGLYMLLRRRIRSTPCRHCC